jgi:cold shock CspA family protein
MESGYVKFFLTHAEKLFGFVVDEDGKDVFFHYSSGRAVEVKGPGEVQLVETTYPLRSPKKWDRIMFERADRPKGPAACPWCFEEEYEKVLAASKHDLTVEEAQKYLAGKPCQIFEYSESWDEFGIGVITTTVTTEITWMGLDGKYVAGRGTYQTSSKSCGNEKTVSARVEVFTPGQKQFTASTVFVGQLCEAFRANLNVKSQQKGQKVIVLWAGGYDEYVVDPAKIREMTLAETMWVNQNSCSPIVGDRSWLRCSFVKEFGGDSQVVRILCHLGGGD